MGTTGTAGRRGGAGVAFTAADAANVFGGEEGARGVRGAIVDAAWAIVVQDLMSDKAIELYDAVEPSLPRTRFRPAPLTSDAVAPS